MPDTPNLALTLLEAAQAQKHVTVNEALHRLDAALHASVIRVETTPPAVVDGERFLVGAGATGDWAGRDATIAYAINSGWDFLPALEGWTVWDQARDLTLRYDGTAWGVIGGAEADGLTAATETATMIETVALAGATAQTAFSIPDRAVVLAVSTRVTTALAGATNFDVGVSPDGARFASQLGGNLDDANTGGGTPYMNFGAEPIVFTGRDGGGAAADFTGGAVSVALHMIIARGPA